MGFGVKSLKISRTEVEKTLALARKKREIESRSRLMLRKRELEQYNRGGFALAKSYYLKRAGTLGSAEARDTKRDRT